MIEKFRQLFEKYREIIVYVFFGVVTTLVNMIVLEIFARLGCPTWLSNAIAWVVAVLVAYFTNRRWVFGSRTSGSAAMKEFASFVAARLGTGVMDEILMVVGVDVLGPALFSPVPELWRQAVKLFSNILVMILNYVFSKRFIFKPKGRKAKESPAE